MVDARSRSRRSPPRHAEAERILESAKTEAWALAQDQVEERERLDSDLVGMRSWVSDLRSRLAGLATELDSQMDPLAVELDASIEVGTEIALQVDGGAESPEPEQTEVLDLVRGALARR